MALAGRAFVVWLVIIAAETLHSIARTLWLAPIRTALKTSGNLSASQGWCSGGRESVSFAAVPAVERGSHRCGVRVLAHR